MKFTERLRKGWNAFTGRSVEETWDTSLGQSYGSRPDRFIFTRGNERSLVTTALNRIAVDCAAVDIKHVRCDLDGRYLEDIKNSGLSECLTLEANMDQTSRMFIQDVVMSLLDEGSVAIVPTDADINIQNDSFDCYTLRTGRVVTWYPGNVKVDIYNERTGHREQIIVPKKSTAIIENPFYQIMNQPNSTMQRLVRKLALLDRQDETNTSGKLDMIIQLPYIIKTEARREQAEKRRKDIEMQLSSSQYGIAYTDGTEKITQLNRSIESQIQKEIEYLTDQFLSQLGLTKEILNGTADEKAMLNYQSRIIEPIMSAIIEEMRRKFLTKTARTQGQNIMMFRDPFKLVPVNDIAEIADKFTRNEIMTSNEIRQAIGMVPSEDPRADELRNSNLSESSQDVEARLAEEQGYDEMAQAAIGTSKPRYLSADEYEEYLSHHGILGQKWGKRNGPPYPLDSGDHSALEKKLNNFKDTIKSKLSDKNKDLQYKYNHRDPMTDAIRNSLKTVDDKEYTDDELVEKWNQWVETRDPKNPGTFNDFLENNGYRIHDTPETVYSKLKVGDTSTVQLKDIEDKLYENYMQYPEDFIPNYDNMSDKELTQEVYDKGFKKYLNSLGKENMKEILEDYHYEFSDSTNKSSKTDKYVQVMLNNAKKDGMYDMEFLETIQNTNLLDSNSNDIYKEYEKYLKNPEDYMTSDENYRRLMKSYPV